MKLDRKKNSARNIFFGFINKFVTILFPFILRTILIHTMGEQYLGLSSLFTSILQVLSLSELGIGSAMVFELYKPIAENDYKKICQLQKIYKFIYKIIGTVILTLGICVLPFLKFFIKGGYPEDVNIYVLYILYLINTSASYLLFSYKSTLLTAYQRRDIVSNIGTIIHLILYIIQMVMLILFHNYYAYVVWIPIFTILENFITAIYVNKLYSKLKPEGRIEKRQVKEIFIKVRDLFGHKLSSVVTNSVDTIVISSFLGLSMVTIYNNYYYILSAVSGILDIVYQGILAGIGNSIASETKEKNHKDFNRLFFINAWIVGWCSICFLCLYQPMMKIWMGKKLMLETSSIILLAIYFYVWKIRQTILIYKDATGMWNIDKIKPYVEIIVNLTLNIILVQIIGINGIIISTIVSMLVVSLPWETGAFFKNYFFDKTNKYYSKLVFYTFITIFNGIITFYICSFININDKLNFICKAIVCIIIPNIFYLFIYRKDENLYWVKNTIKGLIKERNNLSKKTQL